MQKNKGPRASLIGYFKLYKGLQMDFIVVVLQVFIIQSLDLCGKFNSFVLLLVQLNSMIMQFKADWNKSFLTPSFIKSEGLN